MVVTFIGMLIFWAGFAAWYGSRSALKGDTMRARIIGAVTVIAGIAGVVYGMRLLAV